MKEITHTTKCPCGMEWKEREDDLKEKPANGFLVPHPDPFCTGIEVWQERKGFRRYYEKEKRRIV